MSRFINICGACESEEDKCYTFRPSDENKHQCLCGHKSNQHIAETSSSNSAPNLLWYHASYMSCRAILEAAVKDYCRMHNKDSSGKCTTKYRPENTSVVNVLEHIAVCPTKIGFWSELIKHNVGHINPAVKAFQTLSDKIHNTRILPDRIALVPSDLHPKELRFLVQILEKLRYQTGIVSQDGTRRPPTDEERTSPPGTPEKKQKRKKPEKETETEDEEPKKKKKKKPEKETETEDEQPKKKKSKKSRHS